MFLHFGLNTFEDEEWTDGTKPATDYCPSAIDAEQWVRAARDAGMKYIILTVKHHDGFCLWDSKHTDYDPKLFTYNGNLYYLPWESIISLADDGSTTIKTTTTSRSTSWRNHIANAPRTTTYSFLTRRLHATAACATATWNCSSNCAHA